MFKPDGMPIPYVSQLMHAPPSAAKAGGMDPAMKKFGETGAWNLPVLLDGDNIWGSSSKSRIFGVYRKLLSEESHVWNSDQ